MNWIALQQKWYKSLWCYTWTVTAETISLGKTLVITKEREAPLGRKCGALQVMIYKVWSRHWSKLDYLKDNEIATFINTIDDCQ